ncbi:MAG: hypothetical protein L6405_09065 [Actinomycetia bacterium]|nr:hypothetical protein [Actinomycetes bacterium]
MNISPLLNLIKPVRIFIVVILPAPFRPIKPEPKIGDFGFFDFSKGKEIIESGRKAAIEKIPEIKRKLRIR